MLSAMSRVLSKGGKDPRLCEDCLSYPDKGTLAFRQAILLLAKSCDKSVDFVPFYQSYSIQPSGGLYSHPIEPFDGNG